MKVLFAPDWRAGVPYQRLLAEALADVGVEVDFLSRYRRVLPLTRLLRERSGPSEILHLHWPEAYYPLRDDGWDWFRRARFSTDLALATRHTVLATTAHNLLAHNRSQEPFARHNPAATFRRARVVFAHSPQAKAQLVERFRLEPERVQVVPHGDLSAAMPLPGSRLEARTLLRLGEEKICLMFGAIEPYKGLEEVLAHWQRRAPDATLVIAGQPMSDEYGASIARAAVGCPRVLLHLQRLSDQKLARWLCAADCVLFNYRAIFTSGAATLARSWGVPLLLPARLDTVDLAEPDPRVFRFQSLDDDFAKQLGRALAIRPDFAAAAPWRWACRWSEVARLTAAGYRSALLAGES
ncbi:MAG: hypothetical protein QOE70_1472 [Chthoniobacter sp.]|jgi:glycosyltransferase involved in cell wall biosynthesis|nr:hypothetical protein [Chthoniobacter sp.]